MKITTADGMVFEGTLAEYEEFLAFAERKVAEVEAPYEPTTITFEGAEYLKVGRDAQVGDVVIFRENTYRGLTNGIPYLVEDSGGTLTVDNHTFLYSPEYGRTRETVDVYEPKLKAGDFVKFTKGTPSILAGKPYEVFEDDGLYFVDEDGDMRWHHFVFEYEIVDAETAKWAKLGRNVGEFKKGDIVRVLDTIGTVALKVGQITTVAEDGVTDAGSSTVNTISSGTRYAKVELIAPVEATQN